MEHRSILTMDPSTWRPADVPHVRTGDDTPAFCVQSFLVGVGLGLAEVIFCEGCLSGVERRLNDISNVPTHHSKVPVSLK